MGGARFTNVVCGQLFAPQLESSIGPVPPSSPPASWEAEGPSSPSEPTQDVASLDPVPPPPLLLPDPRSSPTLTDASRVPLPVVGVLTPVVGAVEQPTAAGASTTKRAA